MLEPLRRTAALVRQKYRRDGFLSLLEYTVRFPLGGLLVAATGNVVGCRGVTMHLDGPGIDLGTKGLLASGRYERAEVAAVDAHLPSDLDVVELGGGIGFLACYVNRRLVQGATHVVLEPDPAVAETLERNVLVNGCDVRVDRRAYAPTPGPVGFFRHGSFKMGGSHRQSDRSLTVEGVDLGTLIETYDLGPFTLIADVEGAEADLVAAELDLLEDRCALLVVEFHAAFVDNAAAVERARRTLDGSTFERVDEYEDVVVYRNPAYASTQGSYRSRRNG